MATAPKPARTAAGVRREDAGGSLIITPPRGKTALGATLLHRDGDEPAPRPRRSAGTERGRSQGPLPARAEPSDPSTWIGRDARERAFGGRRRKLTRGHRR